MTDIFFVLISGGKKMQLHLLERTQVPRCIIVIFSNDNDGGDNDYDDDDDDDDPGDYWGSRGSCQINPELELLSHSNRAWQRCQC